MTKWGEKINDISIEELQEKLASVDNDAKAVKRLMVAIAYKHGTSPADIEDMYGISKKNVYQWLDRFEERELDDALYDEPKPGRPPKLSDDQREKLQHVLEKAPEDAGYTGIQAWTPQFVQHWLKTHFDVEYTLRHVRRLMDDAGLSWRTARPEHYEANPEDVAEFQETFKKSDEN
ncbi:IS630 family transposase [Halanaeroarchaeum sulfurireducens]|uniref:Transposase n=1 Tax=Halanaeroarchaeum sulfurireducens TaxID=1604004 RepID=A0A0F7P7E4_9EURY|nr:IS630 family transposase [Halanaeroarchaeum sulfurireducens]AKH96617.1 transposase [Halanaeroarchaeum sulfurireducens]AKH98191.1 ISSod10-type transposase ISHwa16 [Halanaeroarchaeum sulfurireducens]ALG81019.1 transposase [Halanaeroarchaeum sulfurireducens]ALG82585.1 ISSod10-type transposase ISHwa16 [Halanaeroarchaeum sulfurireducens]